MKDVYRYMAGYMTLKLHHFCRIRILQPVLDGGYMIQTTTLRNRRHRPAIRRWCMKMSLPNWRIFKRILRYAWRLMKDVYRYMAILQPVLDGGYMIQTTTLRNRRHRPAIGVTANHNIPQAKTAAMVHENVIAQLANIQTHPAVRLALDEGRLDGGYMIQTTTLRNRRHRPAIGVTANHNIRDLQNGNGIFPPVRCLFPVPIAGWFRSWSPSENPAIYLSSVMPVTISVTFRTATAYSTDADTPPGSGP
jgi:hypothetical protein